MSKAVYVVTSVLKRLNRPGVRDSVIGGLILWPLEALCKFALGEAASRGWIAPVGWTMSLVVGVLAFVWLGSIYLYCLKALGGVIYPRRAAGEVAQAVASGPPFPSS
jgi:hypothetical protein